MDMTITFRDTSGGQVQIDITRLSDSVDSLDSVMATTVLAVELLKNVESLGEVETNLCGIPFSDDCNGDWE